MAVTEQPQAHAAPSTSDVRLDHVTKEFDDVRAVDDLSLEIERGSFFALLGPSGCGKTTTLRMIGGFEEPTEGTIYLGDEPVSGRPPYKRDVNTVFQSYALFPHLTSSRTSPSACAVARVPRQRRPRPGARHPQAGRACTGLREAQAARSSPAASSSASRWRERS